MKSCIIAGISRSGKTTLAHRLQKHTGYSLISADALISTFEWKFPQLNIRHNFDFDGVSARITDFLAAYVDHLATWQNTPFILDIAYMSPELAVHYDLHTKYKMVFLGYAHLEAREKLRLMRAHTTDHHDWTRALSDESLLPEIEGNIERSRMIEASAHRLGLTYIDTGADHQTALDRAFELLTQ